MDALRVGVDGRFAAARYDGVGRCTVALLGELARLPDGPALVSLWPAGEEVRHALPEVDPARLRRIPASAPPESARGQWELARVLRGESVDVWHQAFPAGPLPLRTPRVVSVYDCIPERGGWPGGRARLGLYRAAVWSAVRGAARVIVPSESTAADLARFYGLGPRRVEVVPLGQEQRSAPPDAEVAEVLAGLGLHAGEYLLSVGRPRPHKGLGVLARALAALPPPRRPRWVHVGRPDPRLPDGHAELATELGLELLSLQDLSDHDLAALYRGACLVALPSLVEGFGLPLLEALALGVPVLASDIQPFRVGGAGVARFAPAGQVAAWSAALEEALADGAWQQRARREGPRQAGHFPWSATARRTADIYASVA